jgi:hypothetical protein
MRVERLRVPGWLGARTSPCGVSARVWYCSQVRLWWRWPKASCSGTMVMWYGRGEEGIGGVGGGVLEVGRVEVDLVGGEGADKLLLEVECGDRAAREIVVEAAVLHGWPVADLRGVEDGVGAVSGDELLDRLQGVEDAGIGRGGDGEALAVGDDGVAFRLDCVGHVRGRGVGGEVWGQGVGIDGIRERGPVAGDQDVDG